MSGVKRTTVTVDQTVLDSLRKQAAAAAANAAKANAANELAKATNNYLDEANKRIAELTANAANLNTLVSNLREKAAGADDQISQLKTKLADQVANQQEDMRAQEEKHEKELKELDTNFRKDLANVALNIADTIKATRNKLEDRIQAVKNESDEQIGSVRKDLNDVNKTVENIKAHIKGEQDEKKKIREIASTYLEVANAKMTAAKGCKHGIREVGEDSIDVAQKHIKNAAVDLDVSVATALAHAQNALDEATVIHEKAHAAELAWIAAKEQAQNALLTAKATVDSLRGGVKTEIEDDEGEKHPVEVDVNEWSGKELDRIEKELNKCGDTVNNDESKCAALNEVTTKILNLRAQAEQASCCAAANMYQSQGRYDIAGDVIKALEEQGFNVAEEDKGYRDGNELGSYLVRAVDLVNKGIVTVEVFPEGDNTKGNEIEVKTYGAVAAQKGVIGKVLKNVIDPGADVKTEQEDLLPINEAPNHVNVNPVHVNAHQEHAQPKQTQLQRVR